MAKRVKVVLTESIATLGRDGDVVEVAPGYARNFLLPLGKAANVTPSILKQIERKRAKEKIAAEKIKQEIIENYALEETIILTGHSLGGAISQIIGLWLEDDAYDVQIFTYGSPTITPASLGGDPIHFRVAIRNDPVPFLPPYPYQHWGIKIDAQTLDWSEYHKIEDFTKIDARDHSIKEYIKILKRHIDS